MGHVFHPGHEALHGITVVVNGASGRTYVGRYHESGPRGVVLRDVAVREVDDPVSVADWVARLKRYGVRVDHASLVLAPGEAEAIVPLGAWGGSST